MAVVVGQVGPVAWLVTRVAPVAEVVVQVAPLAEVVAQNIIIIFHETHPAYRLWRAYIHFGIETLCCTFVSPVSYQTFCRGPPLVHF